MLKLELMLSSCLPPAAPEHHGETRYADNRACNVFTRHPAPFPPSPLLPPSPLHLPSPTGVKNNKITFQPFILRNRHTPTPTRFFSVYDVLAKHALCVLVFVCWYVCCLCVSLCTLCVCCFVCCGVEFRTVVHLLREKRGGFYVETVCLSVVLPACASICLLANLACLFANQSVCLSVSSLSASV